MRRLLSALLAVGTGFGLWFLFDRVWGAEPWDGPGFKIYCLILNLAGVFCTLLASPRRLLDSLLWTACVVLGEFLFALIDSSRWNLWPLALIALIVLSFPVLIGAIFTQLLLKKYGR
ncbi:MAG: hypothetical protein IT472_07780 [Thermomonas sp.]|uniref:hypothetical protein n=1 Tax=Thermomonas sp. TaxID=1971895 RepID=UPI002612E5A8|nr:hypothetical protein [Thermomonas sp.]MCC7097062.1 hypothetical protein [Thermomonas sp.]